MSRWGHGFRGLSDLPLRTSSPILPQEESSSYPQRLPPRNIPFRSTRSTAGLHSHHEFRILPQVPFLFLCPEGSLIYERGFPPTPGSYTESLIVPASFFFFLLPGGVPFFLTHDTRPPKVGSTARRSGLFLVSLAIERAPVPQPLPRIRSFPSLYPAIPCIYGLFTLMGHDRCAGQLDTGKPTPSLVSLEVVF